MNTDPQQRRFAPPFPAGYAQRLGAKEVVMAGGGSPNRRGASSLHSWVRLVVWPAVLLVALAMYRDPLSDFIRRVTKAEFVKDEKGLKVALVAANLGAAEATRSAAQPEAKISVDLPGVAAAATRAAAAPALSHAKVLWVDDNPDNNRYERNALGALGVQFDLATNTEQALKRLKEATFNLVISDFKRTDDPQAGYTLLDELKKLASAPPSIIYSSSANPEHERDAKSRGAYGQTNSPQRLVDMSVNAILGK